MGELKRTVLHNRHARLRATLVEFGGWEMPVQYPEGIVHVMVNGVVVIRDGEHTGARPGRALRHRSVASTGCRSSRS